MMHGCEDANKIWTIPIVRKLKLSLLDVYAHLLGLAVNSGALATDMPKYGYSKGKRLHPHDQPREGAGA